MDLRPQEQDEGACYRHQWVPRIGDVRPRRTLEATGQGILGAASLGWSRIAAASPALAAVLPGEKRVRRLASADSISQSPLEAEQLSGRMRAQTGARVADGGEASWGVWAADRRKSSARAMEALREGGRSGRAARRGLAGGRCGRGQASLSHGGECPLGATLSHCGPPGFTAL